MGTPKKAARSSTAPTWRRGRNTMGRTWRSLRSAGCAGGGGRSKGRGLQKPHPLARKGPWIARAAHPGLHERRLAGQGCFSPRNPDEAAGRAGGARTSPKSGHQPSPPSASLTGGDGHQPHGLLPAQRPGQLHKPAPGQPGARRGREQRGGQEEACQGVVVGRQFVPRKCSPHNGSHRAAS